jgi:hypothetical protein
MVSIAANLSKPLNPWVCFGIAVTL